MSKSNIRQFFEKCHPLYFSVETYPASECVRIHQITKPWGIFSNFAHTPICVECVTFDAFERFYETMKFIGSEAVHQANSKRSNP